ncbi:MAG: precorrin-3B C(17)-methyltransferase [Candidatus Humimicrobiaceae bacterium]
MRETNNAAKTPDIYVIGIGPGCIDEMTFRAKKALDECDLIIGYSKYIELLRGHFPEIKLISSGMRKEIQRCEFALKKASEGEKVAVVSSGDPGIYGMAGLMLEIADKTGFKAKIKIIPGITAASAAAAILGAPIMNDFAAISLSDLLTSPNIIFKRVRLAAEADFVICFYNPKSLNRTEQIGIAMDIILKYRCGQTPVGIVRNAGRKKQGYIITTLNDMPGRNIDMSSLVIVGNSKSYVKNKRIITPRGYKI